MTVFDLDRYIDQKFTNLALEDLQLEHITDALGKTKMERQDGTTLADMSVFLDHQRKILGKLNVLTEANKLASQICSTIPKCIQ